MILIMRQVEIRASRLHWEDEKVQTWRTQVDVAHLSPAEEEMIFHAVVAMTTTTQEDGDKDGEEHQEHLHHGDDDDRAKANMHVGTPPRRHPHPDPHHYQALSAAKTYVFCQSRSIHRYIRRSIDCFMDAVVFLFEWTKLVFLFECTKRMECMDTIMIRFSSGFCASREIYKWIYIYIDR
jgi:hypothetical protein